ncbi:MAG: fasciclin domain-containing protein, partial [Odoribacter sp.]|nr:fasciclin domain-containing protein [Odoribacter sp.]
MKKLLILTGIMAVMACFTQCEDSLEDGTFMAYEEQPVGIYLETQPQFSEWVKMLKRVDLYNALNISTKFTCFIADNDAVAEYLQSKGYRSVDDMSDEALSYLMRYHIIPGVAYPHSSMSGQISNPTASDDYLLVKYRDGGINAMYVNDTALIIRKDIEVINGYLHQLDRVLDPITETVWDLLRENENYSIFRQAVEACGLQEWLTTKKKEVNEVKLDDYKTVFVVSDEVFRANGINSLEELKKHFVTEAEFQKYVAYHVVNTNSDFGDLATFSTDSKEKVKNLLTRADGQLITVEDLKGNVIINRHSDSVTLVRGGYDQKGQNGYVHEVNKLMEVSAPQPVTVTFDLCDIEDCRILEMYGKHTTAIDQQTYSIDRKNAKEIEWFTVPDNDNAVKYQLRTQGWNLGKDLLYVNLGYVGWLKIKSPVIAAGTYKVTLYKFAYGDRGSNQMYIDDEKMGPILQYSSGSGNRVNLATRTFTDSRSHTIE